MSQPLLFVDPSDNQIKKVIESEVVTLDEIDTRIAHHQSEINRLNTERVKFLDLQGAVSGDSSSSTDQASAPADRQPAADQGSSTATDSGSAEAPASAGDATSAPADAPATPAEPVAPAAPVESVGEPSDPSSPANDPSGQAATPPIAA